jgi:hypothetical protein
VSEESSAEDRKPDPQILPDKPGDSPGPGKDQDETDQMPSGAIGKDDRDNGTE